MNETRTNALARGNSPSGLQADVHRVVRMKGGSFEITELRKISGNILGL